MARRDLQHTGSSTRTFMPAQAAKEDGKAPPKPRPKLKLPKITFSPWILVALLIAFALFMVVQNRIAQQKIEQARQNGTSKQVSDTISSVGKLFILPKNETPTVATIARADRLKGQAFFANARDGDKVLIYNQQKKAILYRPSTNQLVNVSTVSVPASGTTGLNQ